MIIVAHDACASKISVAPSDYTIRKNCAQCGALIEIPGRYGGGVRFCSRECSFWSRVDKREPSECWAWTAGKDAYGYGSFGFKRTIYKSHRVALEIRLGRSLSSEECACHDCDNPICVNPGHLRPGTRAENLSEAHAKGRTSTPPHKLKPGASPNNTKLTNEMVLDMRSRRASGDTIRSIAAAYDVRVGAVYAICRRHTWKHLP